MACSATLAFTERLVMVQHSPLRTPGETPAVLVSGVEEVPARLLTVVTAAGNWRAGHG
jgi:hypothetical protein